MEENFYQKNYTMQKSGCTDLVVYNTGIEKCRPLHSYGPAVREHYLFHYVLEGEGVFEANREVYSICGGQGFLIFPNTITWYQANEQNPWFYIWLEFDGIKAAEYLRSAGLSLSSPIYTAREKPDPSPSFLLELINDPANEMRVSGLSFLFLESIIKNALNKPHPVKKNIKSVYVETAVNYITVNYWKPIRVQELADLCGLDRSYFCRIFKDTTGFSPQEFLLRFKIDRACELLTRPEPSMSIGDVSRSVGFYDQLAFSKAFKKSMGLSPTDYIKARTN